MIDQVPEGWARIRLGDVFDCWGGMTPSTSEAAYWGGSTPWISSKDVKDSVVGSGTEHVTDRALAENRLRKCPPGSVLVVVRSGVLAHTLPVAVASREVVVNQDLKVLDAGDRELNAWAALHIRASQQAILEANRKDGTTVQSIRVPELLNRKLPVAPLAEQRRIVARVEALMDLVCRAKDRLDRVPVILKRFRQAVLAAACSGQLTEEWRGSGDAQALLAQIAAERASTVARRRWRERNDPTENGIPPVIWDIPAHWSWAPLRDLLDYERAAAYGVLQPGPDVPGGVPFVRVCDLGNGTVHIDGLKSIAPDIDCAYPRTRLQGDEVLVSLVGTIGRTAVVPPGAAGANVARAIAVLPLCPHVLPRFVTAALDHPAKNAELVDLAREVARKTLNLGLLKNVRIPVAPLKEQVEIVRRVDALFALAKAVERRVAVAAARADKITQAILAKAFRGDLVPTEAELARAEGREFESGEELLARVAEQAGSAKQPKRRHAQRAGRT